MLELKIRLEARNAQGGTHSLKLFQSQCNLTTSETRHKTQRAQHVKCSPTGDPPTLLKKWCQVGAIRCQYAYKVVSGCSILQ